MTMTTRTLGTGGAALSVSALGLGCMGMSFAYSGRDDAESEATLLAAVDAGVTFFDTADMYAAGANEELLGRVLRPHADRVVIATKFANRVIDGRPVVDGRPEWVRAACDASLRRLGIDTIDLYYQHRVDPGVPVEETWGAMSELVTAGKVRFLGISEAAASTIRRAHQVHPVTAVQTEWSLWSREVEADGVLDATRELGIGFVPYSPIGRGFLAGAIRSADDLADDDWRRMVPRFQGDTLDANLPIANAVAALAAARGVTPAQLSLAWLLAQGDDIVPIPGTKRRHWLQENLAAATVEITPDDLAALERAAPVGAAQGARYPEAGMRYLNG